MKKICDNCKREFDLKVWYGHGKGWVCTSCAASLYHQAHSYHKSEIASLKDKLKETNFQAWRLDQCNKDNITQLAEANEKLSKFKVSCKGCNNLKRINP